LQRFLHKYFMRPICKVCNQRAVAINYRKQNQVHYRSRCDVCIKKNKKVKPAEPRWKSAGYKKKAACDRCGFRAKYASQLLVFHCDGNLHSTNSANLRTVCLNCVEEVKRLDAPWSQGDLEADF
jgi:hypothetical protein